MPGQDLKDPFKINNVQPHEARYFAMLNNAVAISGDSKLEGGTPRDALAYYNYLLNVDLPNCPLSLGLTKEQEDSVKKRMYKLEVMNTHLEDLFSQKSLYTDAGMRDVIKMIDENCKNDGACYLPSGYKNITEGHFAGLKIKKLSNSKYVFSCINHGEGMQFHRKVSKSGSKIKYSYESDEYEIDLQSEEGREFLQKMLELRFDSQMKPGTEINTNPYSSEDLYGLLKLYGKASPPRSLEEMKEKSVTPQRTGTCTVINTHAIARDTLIDNKANFNARKRYHFVIKLRSLIAAFNEYCKPNSTYTIPIMEWALNEFSVRINKQYRNILSDDELIYCSRLHLQILERLDQDKTEDIKSKCKPKSNPSLIGDAPKYNFNVSATKKSVKNELISNQINPPFIKRIKEIKPEDIKDILKIDTKSESQPINCYYNSDNNLKLPLYQKYLQKVYDLLNSLPHCTGLDKDDFWDKVPESHLNDILNNMHESIYILSRLKPFKVESPLQIARHFALSLMVYDIAAQLAPRLSGIKLADKYALGLDDIYSEQYFFTDPIAYHTVKRIANNFEQRALHKERIFTNSVHYDENKYDHTVYYVINVLLTQHQRTAVAEQLKKSKGGNLAQYSDEELFGELIDNLNMRDEEGPILDKSVINLIGIAGAAHGLGKYASGCYSKIDDLWYFSKSQFHKEFKRQTLSKMRSPIFKHLPNNNLNVATNAHEDYSENTIYHPHQDLLQTREFSGTNDIYPYQPNLSGSIRPNSVIWQPEKKQLFLYEELNEDFRSIECSPNFQIVKTMDWAYSNLDKLTNTVVRNRINELLFQYGKLDSAFANNLDITIRNMQQLLAGLVKYCKEEASDDTEILIWATNLAHDLRFHLEVAAKLYNLPISELKMPSFKEVLINRIKNEKNENVRSRLASQMIRNFRNSSPLTVDDCCMLLICRIAANLGDEAGVSEEVWQQLNSELTDIIKANKDTAARTLSELLSTHNLTSVKKWNLILVDSQLQSIDTQFIIDLETGSLQAKGINKIKKERTNKTISDNKDLFTSLDLTPQNIKLLYDCDSTDMLISDDGKWEFSNSATWTSDSGTKFSITSTYHSICIQGNIIKFKLLNKDEVTQLFEKTNPFESDPNTGSKYQYWQSTIDKDLIFVRQRNSEVSYCYSLKNKQIIQLAINQQGEWQRNSKILLNLVKPQTSMEEQWAKRLAPMFGLTNIRCRAKVNEDKTKWHLESIEHLVMGLSFSVNNKQQLMCDQEPGYYLSRQPSFEILHGIPNIIILVNDKGENKFIIPAFALNEGEKNNAFTHEDMIDYGALCNNSKTYYHYSINSQNELVSYSDNKNYILEGNLYLAILYRSLGEFELAINYLERCKKHENIDANVWCIALQTFKRKIKSPTGAAFDLKLACYLKEHQTKWARMNSQTPFESPQYWDEFIAQQLEFYNNSFSSFKKDVAIIPDYCRLTEYELGLLNPSLINDNKSNQVHYVSQPIEPSKRLKKSSQLPSQIVGTDAISSWNHYVDKLIKIEKGINIDERKKLLQNPSTFRLYDNSYNSALHYLLVNFSDLFKDAISDDNKRRDSLQRKLFTLLQNDTDPPGELYDLIALLIFSSKYSKEFFKDFKMPSEDVRAKEEPNQLFSKLGFKRKAEDANSSTNIGVIKEVGKIFHQNKYKLKDDSYNNIPVYLFEYDKTTHELAIETSLPNDLTAKPIRFELAPISYESKCKHPLLNIAIRYFTEKGVPVSKTEFALKQLDMPGATLLERKLLYHYQAGHEKNKSKVKLVYSASTGQSLTALKSELELVKNEDTQKLNELEKKLRFIANRTPAVDRNATVRDKALAYNLLQARANSQKHLLSISDLFKAFLQKNPAILTVQNPFLTQNDVEQMLSELADYALLQSRVAQVNQSLDIIGDKTSFSENEKYKEQLLAGILYKPRVYDINQYPEFLVYEYASNRILREDQVVILKSLIKLIEKGSVDMHHALLQFAAGGGKTAVLIPILAQRFASKGFLPVIINTNELYDIGLEEVPKNLRACFKQNIEVIEKELDHKWTETELKKLLNDLEQWRNEKKCLIIKSVTWHSINIAAKLAYLKRDTELAKAAQGVLNFFKYRSVKLEDECHIVSDPMQQSIKTEGKPQKIPNNQINLLLKFYDYLMGRRATDREVEKNIKIEEIAKMAGIKSNRKDPVTKDELTILQKLLVDVITDENVFKEIPRGDFTKYLLQEDNLRPEWLVALYNKNEEGKEMADMIVLGRAFLRTHLPYILSQQYLKDYGASIHNGDLTVAPKHEGNSVSSHFGDHTLVAALTIQLYEQRGLLPEQVDELIDQVVKEHKKERLWNFDYTKPTQAEQWLRNIIPAFNGCNDITQEMRTNLKNNIGIHFTKNAEVIKKYLRLFALRQIKVHEKRITSTAAELQAGFTRSILFSATPSLPEIYPPFLDPNKNCFLEESFEAQVIDTLLSEQNRGKFLIKDSLPIEDFFKQFPPELLSKMTTLIDRGSLLTDFEASDIIKSYFAIGQPHTPTNVAAYFSNKGMKLIYNTTPVKEIKISGSALVEEIKKQGQKPEEFLLFLFLELSKTTGTDISRPHNAHAGLTVGKQQTVTETIQAAMRQRKLLDENAQSITWIMFQALYREINPCELISIPSMLPVNIDYNTLPFKSNTAYVCSGDKLYYINKDNKECMEILITAEVLTNFNNTMKPSEAGRKLLKEDLQKITAITKHVPEDFDARQIFYWMIKNEAKAIENKIINRAYQGIYQAISELAWKEVQKDPRSISIYEKALEQRQELSPYLIYEIASTKDKTESVLKNYRDKLIRQFNFDFRMDVIPPETLSRIDKIIQETSNLIDQLQDPPKTQLGVEVQQEMEQELQQDQEQQQELQIKNRNDSASEFVFNVEQYSSKEDNLNTIFDQSNASTKKRYQLPKLPDCDGVKLPELYLCQNHFAVTQQKNNTGRSSLEELKPINNLLVRIMPGNQVQFIACTAAGMEYFADQMNQIQFEDKYPCYAIIGSSGAIFHKSNNIHITDLSQLIDGEVCQKMLTYTHFLNGEISNPIMLGQIVKKQGWDKKTYERLVNGITNVHVSQRPVSLLKNEVLETYCGWNDEKFLMAMTTSMPRSKSSDENGQQKLRPVDSLENHVENTSIPITSPEHALGNDLLGKKPQPICKRPRQSMSMMPLRAKSVHITAASTSGTSTESTAAVAISSTSSSVVLTQFFKQSDLHPARADDSIHNAGTRIESTNSGASSSSSTPNAPAQISKQSDLPTASTEDKEGSQPNDSISRVSRIAKELAKLEEQYSDIVQEKSHQTKSKKFFSRNSEYSSSQLTQIKQLKELYLSKLKLLTPSERSDPAIKQLVKKSEEKGTIKLIDFHLSTTVPLAMGDTKSRNEVNELTKSVKNPNTSPTKK